jgi:hypothetical protein
VLLVDPEESDLEPVAAAATDSFDEAEVRNKLNVMILICTFLFGELGECSWYNDWLWV